MFHLEARVQFKEIEDVLGVSIEVLLKTKGFSLDIRRKKIRSSEHSTVPALTYPTSFAKRTAARSMSSNDSSFAIVTGASSIIF
jgi:hypothetical protein